MRIHDLTQGSDEWAAFRLTHHGASEAAAMLGLSKLTTRSELLRVKHTFNPKEFSDWVQENILDYGHHVEALARPLVEEIIGDDLYPVTCSDEDVGGHLSASCDGLTMAFDTAFEHKQWNEELAASVSAGVVPDSHMPQCQQIMMITGAKRVIFTVSDGTPENFVSTEVEPDATWFERIVDGWAQFDRDLAEYVLPEDRPILVAEAVQALPAVAVQISGQITVRENFNAFETALRDFLDNKLIREPQTDQDFVDLDQQIKAMKKAEDTLNAAEAMMLAQIESVDQAKRQKDMLTKLLRDNRLMAEKLLEREKASRRQERIDGARTAFADHLFEAQRGLDGLRLDIVTPDFAGAIKGLKTLSSIDDKIATALANGKIVVDRQARDMRAKLDWINENASEHRALLADLQQLVAKPFDDFRLAVVSRIDAHKKAEEQRLEAEREKIRQQEREKLAAEAERTKSAPEPESVKQDPTQQRMATSVSYGRAAPASAPAPVDNGARLKLGDINALLSPLSVTVEGLTTLGFSPVGTDRAAKLYAATDFPAMCAAMHDVLANALIMQQVAA
ncbi:YqaJ viral recombinase family protein [Dyella kyungheensis]|uniref:YqaJ viral recombinase family protein n=1 Tax=Dyella kyungheensis TaxID=1242174 RepID=UPI003CF703C3